MKKFFQRSIRKQILAVFFSAAFIPVIVIGLITIREAYRQAQDRYGSQIIADCSRVKSMLFDTTLSLYNSCEPIVSSQAYRDLLGAREGVLRIVIISWNLLFPHCIRPRQPSRLLWSIQTTRLSDPAHGSPE